MRIWALTEIGKRAARSVRNPDSPVYKVLHALDRLGSATQDQIASYTGLDGGTVGSSLSRLSHTQPPLVGLVG